MPPDYDEIRLRLQAIADELAELGMERLRATIDAGERVADPEERRLARARRAVLKAAATLSDRPGPPDEA